MSGWDAAGDGWGQTHPQRRGARPAAHLPIVGIDRLIADLEPLALVYPPVAG